MAEFYYKSKGTADSFTPGVVTAASEKEARAQLDEVYGVKESSTDAVTVQLISKAEFDELKKQAGKADRAKG